MPRRSDARRRAIETAARLFQQQGFHGTGLAQILAESGAPKGSFYYYFPRGKEQLALEAIASANRQMDALFAWAATRGLDAAGYVRALTAGLARWMADSDFTEGCPIASLTLEAGSRSPTLLAACRTAYADWERTVSAALAARGVDRPRARRMALLVVSGINGAMILSRAERSTRPFTDLGRALVAHLPPADGRPPTRLSRR